MDKNLIESYKNEMLQMYRSKYGRVNAVPASTEPEVNVTPDSGGSTATDSSSGRLIGVVTTLRTIYPVKNAKVTVFSGEIDNMQVIDTDFTDESGRTKVFTLQTPSRELSLDSANQIRPYALYNMMVEADGYLTNIHLNIPVFSGVTSLQSANMMLIETAGTQKGPQIFDELQNYNL